MSLQYGELRPTSGWDRFGSLGHRLISTGFASWQRYCTAFQYWTWAKLCGVEQRAPPIFGRAAISLGIDPHSSSIFILLHCKTEMTKHFLIWFNAFIWNSYISIHWVIYIFIYLFIYLFIHSFILPSVFWHCWLGVRKSIQPVKFSDEVLVWLVICLEWGTNDLHMVQLMPLPPRHLLLH